MFETNDEKKKHYFVVNRGNYMQFRRGSGCLNLLLEVFLALECARWINEIMENLTRMNRLQV